MRTFKNTVGNSFFQKLKGGNKELNYGCEIVQKWTVESGHRKIIDLGYAEGVDLLNIKNHSKMKNIELHGVDFRSEKEYGKVMKGIVHHQCLLESEKLSFENEEFDIVILNQVLEHTKDIFWIINEALRVLKVGGKLIVGVPNLASFHNRVQLLIGQQSSSIKILGSHVRGFTHKQTKQCLEFHHICKVVAFKGSGFYLVPKFMIKIMMNIFPTFAVSLFFLCEKKSNNSYLSELKKYGFETAYKGINC